MKLTNKQLTQMIRKYLLYEQMAGPEGTPEPESEKDIYKRDYWKSAETTDYNLYLTKAIHWKAAELEAIAGGNPGLAKKLSHRIGELLQSNLGNAMRNKSFKPKFQLPKGQSVFDYFRRSALKRPWFFKLLKKYGDSQPFNSDVGHNIDEEFVRKHTSDKKFKFRNINMISSKSGMGDYKERDKLRKQIKSKYPELYTTPLMEKGVNAFMEFGLGLKEIGELAGQASTAVQGLVVIMQTVDPTGILSWPDLAKSINSYDSKNMASNASLFFNVIGALPLIGKGATAFRVYNFSQKVGKAGTKTAKSKTIMKQLNDYRKTEPHLLPAAKKLAAKMDPKDGEKLLKAAKAIDDSGIIYKVHVGSFIAGNAINNEILNYINKNNVDINTSAGAKKISDMLAAGEANIDVIASKLAPKEKATG